MSSEQGKAQRIRGYMISKLRQLDENTPWSKATLAKLRRTAGKTLGESPEAWEAILSGMPDEFSGFNGRVSYAEQALHTALTFYALHKQGSDTSMHEEEGLSFGGGIVKLHNANDKNRPGIQRRFDAVITAKDMDELSHHARGLIQLMRASDIPVKLDYVRLAVELFRYQFPDLRDEVRLRWGEDFYKNKKTEDAKNDK